MRTRAAAVGAALVALLAGCAADDGGRAQTVTPPSPTPTVEAPLDEPEPEAEEEPEVEEPATPAGEADLTEALLTLEDMPTGWTTSTPSDDDSDGTGLCGQGPVTELVPPVAEAEAEFEAGDFGPFLVHVVASYERSGAEAAIDALLEAASSCEEWTDDVDGEPITWRVSPLSFPRFGDQTAAFRMRGESDMVTVSADLIVWRRDDALSFVAMVEAFGAPDAEVTEQLVTTADGKLARL